jgi:hypothetical protein
MLAIAMLASRAIASDDRFKIIVNPASGIQSVDRDFLREAYLKKATEWSNGETVHPLDLSPQFPARERFTHDVLHKTPSQLKTYWNQQIFSGKGVPPPEVESTSAAIEYVLANKGAVAYLPADADAGKAKVIPIR